MQNTDTTKLANYLQSATKIIDLAREQNLQLKSDFEKEVSKREKAEEGREKAEEGRKKAEEGREKAVEGNAAVKKLLHAVMERFVPDPRAYICQYFIDQPDMIALEETILAELPPAIAAQQPATVSASILCQTLDRDVITPLEHKKFLEYKGKVQRISKHLNKKKIPRH